MLQGLKFPLEPVLLCYYNDKVRVIGKRVKNMEKNSKKSERAQKEEETLRFWEDKKIFEKSLEKPSPKGEFVFYEGPPTANGMPGIHHLESRSFKDAIPRYKTMQGYHVRRKAGWDTHGLPVEIEVEKKLGFTGKKDIEEYGIEEFNKACRESVVDYVASWKYFTDRIGYWLDYKDEYWTFNPSFMESVWNIVSEVDKQDLLYKDYKVLPWCPRCGTALSSHEVSDGYKKVKDLAVTAKFELEDESRTYLLAWTTTPWTLPGNVGLAVGENIEYVKVESEGFTYIVAKDLVRKIFEDKKFQEKSILKGKDLVGKKYKPLYPYLKELLPEDEKDKLSNAYKIYGANFVTTEEGTGIVHTAVMYGQDDFVLGTEKNLPKHHLVTEDGKFVKGTGFLEDRFVRDEDLAVDIIKDLAHRNPPLLFSKEKHEHTYPHCWRCKTALIYYARDSWYIRMSELRDDLIKENKEINWEPEHIREGRFGEWLREVKDWAISRERYWGTPLPVWKCDDCEKEQIVGSVQELKDRMPKSGNNYFVMRHGESEANASNHTVSIDPDLADKLTQRGKSQVKEALNTIKEYDIDLIVSSPFVRTKETSEIIRQALGLSEEKMIFDERIGEWRVGEGWQGKPWADAHKARGNLSNAFLDALPGGESLLDVRKRVMEFLYELDAKYKDKRILIVSHSGIVKTLITGIEHPEERFIIESLENAEVKEIEFIPLPHDTDYKLDLHKPYIDEVKFACSCGGEMVRTPEVLDVWFDAGSMPFAQDHYPFEKKAWIEGEGYPADYISEAIDQTRGWFYTLHAIGVLTGKGKAYKNVICLGHLLDAEGKKMSKSVGNIVEPLEQIDKYGADILRFWMYTINQPGESKNYDEKIVEEMSRKVIGTLSNVVRFYEMYTVENTKYETEGTQYENILDRWILAKLNKLIEDSTNWLDDYKLLEPARAIREFINDLSTWYIRRSRDRFKSGDSEDREQAIATTRFVVLELSKLMAPFMPFFAEEIYQKMGGEKESVHLEDWSFDSAQGEPEVNEEVLVNMEEVRRIVSLALEARASEGIKVRQPLGTLRVRNAESRIENQEELLALIKDEVNVKEVVFSASGGDADVELDTKITPELLREGHARELIRSIQSLRKKAGLSPDEEVNLMVDADKEGEKLVRKFGEEIQKTAGIKEFKFEKIEDGKEVSLDSLSIKISLS